MVVIEKHTPTHPHTGVYETSCSLLKAQEKEGCVCLEGDTQTLDVSAITMKEEHNQFWLCFSPEWAWIFFFFFFLRTTKINEPSNNAGLQKGSHSEEHRNA